VQVLPIEESLSRVTTHHGLQHVDSPQSAISYDDSLWDAVTVSQLFQQGTPFVTFHVAYTSIDDSDKDPPARPSAFTMMMAKTKEAQAAPNVVKLLGGVSRSRSAG
jgi:hypothetical protein